MSTVDRQYEYDAVDDTLLVKAAKNGTIAAFEQLMSRHTSLVFRVAMHITNSREDAEDVVQDAFLKAFRHLRRFEERARFSTWMTRIAVNTALMKLRGLRRVQTISLDQETDEGLSISDKVADWKPDPDQLYSQREYKTSCSEHLTYCRTVAELSSCCVTSKACRSQKRRRCWD